MIFKVINLLIIFPNFALATGECTFPDRWHGGWFQSGVPEVIYVTRKEISVKGNCVEASNEKFVFKDKKMGCHRCVVVSEKHPNILQYKETLCEPISEMNKLCSKIPGDALLYSLFRREATPTPCPFKGPLTFSYNQGHGLCANPPSTIDSCTSESRLLFKYQACPDVLKTESSVEQVECIGHWKEGSTRYFVARIHSSRTQTDEDRFRCFAWDRARRPGSSEEYRMAQSGDATCNGVFSATDGSRTLKIKKVASFSGCEYPSWMIENRRWHALDVGVSYAVSHKNTSFRVHQNYVGTSIQGYETEAEISGSTSDSSHGRLACAFVKEISDTKAMVVSYSTKDCTSGFTCTVFHKRNSFTVELQQGSQSFEGTSACEPPYFDLSTAKYTTLTSSLSDHVEKCPFNGVWLSEENRCSSNPKAITGMDSGCRDSIKPSIRFINACQEKRHNHVFTCHGHWRENEKTYVVVSRSGESTSPRRLCMVASTPRTPVSVSRDPYDYNSRSQAENPATTSQMISISVHAHSCPRHQVPPTTRINGSFTRLKDCLPLSGSPASVVFSCYTQLFALTLLFGFYSTVPSNIIS